jgi:hypothetical protein
VSAVLVLYPVYPDWVVWTDDARRGRLLLFRHLHHGRKLAEQHRPRNETRGQALSAYMIVQMLGIIGQQVLLNLPRPVGLRPVRHLRRCWCRWPSCRFCCGRPRPRRLTHQTPVVPRNSVRASPLGCVGMLLTGGVFSAMFGMASVWGAQVGLSVSQISIFVGALYVGGLVLQYPIGWAVGPDGPAHS